MVSTEAFISKLKTSVNMELKDNIYILHNKLDLEHLKLFAFLRFYIQNFNLIKLIWIEVFLQHKYLLEPVLEISIFHWSIIKSAFSMDRTLKFHMQHIYIYLYLCYYMESNAIQYKLYMKCLFFVVGELSLDDHFYWFPLSHYQNINWIHY